MRRPLVLDAAFAALTGAAIVACWAVLAGGATSGTSMSLARGVRLLGIGGVTGVLVLTVAVWAPLRRRGELDPRADAAGSHVGGRLLRRLALLGAVGAVATLLAQTAYVESTGVLEAAAPDRWADALGTRSGAWLALSAVALGGVAIVGPTVVRAGSLRTPAGLVAVALLVVLNVAPALGGSPLPSPAGGIGDPPLDPVQVPFEVLHVAGMGAWVGGLLALSVVLPVAARAVSDDAGRTRLLAAVLLRFSPVALTAVVLLTLAGTAIALLSLTTLYDLADTAYGRAIFVKVVLLLIAITIAVLQREYLVPRLERAAGTAQPSALAAEAADGGDARQRTSDGSRIAGPDEEPVDPARARRHVRAAMLAEVLLLVAVLAVTGALAGYERPKALADEPASVARTVDGVDLELTVDPARVGLTRVTLSVAASGAPLRGRATVRMRAVPPGRAGSSDTPVDVDLRPLGGGSWRADAVDLGARGRWRFETVLRTAAGTRVGTTLPVRIR